jgi:hypothetical protein
MIDVVGQRLAQIERAWHAVDEGDHVDREVRLQRGVLVEVVQDDECGSIPLELHHQSRLATGGLVIDVGDAVELARLNEFLDLRRGGRDGRLVRHLGHDDEIVATALFDLRDCSQLDRSSSRSERIDDPLATHDLRAGREVGALDELHQVVGRRVRMIEKVNSGVDHLAQIVRRNVRRHTNRDALAPVHEQVRKPARQDDRHLELT